VQTIYPLALAALFAVELTGHANGQSPPLWGKLSPGSHAVGFRTVWQLDYSRRYNMTFGNATTYATGKAPRPILIRPVPSISLGGLTPLLGLSPIVHLMGATQRSLGLEDRICGAAPWTTSPASVA